MEPGNPHIDRIFKAIADPTRRRIFHALVLAGTALSIMEISAQYNITRQGVTKHIKTLQEAGLIRIDQQGRERFCKAEPQPLKLIYDWIGFYNQFWDDTLDKLEDHLNEED
jgi:DNA-binding transcriptional ArsR family regulator